MEVFPPVFVTGAAGTLGKALQDKCGQSRIRCLPYSRLELDITDAEAVDAVLAKFAATVRQPEPPALRGLVINAAAYTDVDRAEDEEERAFAVNATGAGNVAAAAARHGLDLIHLSTDYVFDGSKRLPYSETDQPHPLNAYGRSKLAGEQAVANSHPTALIVRTSWLYGPGRASFPARILALARQAASHSGQGWVQVAVDQYGSPTAAADLAWGLLELYRRGARGLYHLSGAGSCSRYELAQEVLAAAGLSVELVPASSAAFPGRAVRPSYSVLDCSKARRLGVELPPWRESVHTYVRRYLVEAVK